MRKIREVLRLKHQRKLSERKIANAVGIARSTVSEYLERAGAAGVTWEVADGLADAEVESRLFRQIGRNEPAARAPIDFNWVHVELRRPGVTRQLLWTEYQQAVATDGSGKRPYQYSQFCDLYEEYRAKQQPSMRQVHRAGENLEELNAAIWELLEKLNTRPFQKLEGCRRSAFETLDRPAMRPLPPRRYEIGVWKLGVGVNVDYHFEYDHRLYSVSSTLVNAKVDVRATATVVEAWRGGLRIASHERSYGPKGTAVTNPEHRPRSHREWGNWPPERLVGWAAQTGPKTAEVVAAILGHRTHPETGRRACLALMRMGERYGADRLEAACGRALAINNPRYKSVEAILKNGLDKVPMAEPTDAKPILHDNIRGGAYFDREEIGNDEIEARYLDEERFAIINEPRAHSQHDGDVSEPAQYHQHGRTSSAMGVAERGAASMPLLGVLERLRTLWARAPLPHGYTPTSNNDRYDAMRASHCVSPCECNELESAQRERRRDEMICRSENDVWNDEPVGHRGDA